MLMLVYSTNLEVRRAKTVLCSIVKCDTFGFPVSWTTTDSTPRSASRVGAQTFGLAGAFVRPRKQHKITNPRCLGTHALGWEIQRPWQPLDGTESNPRSIWFRPIFQRRNIRISRPANGRKGAESPDSQSWRFLFKNSQPNVASRYVGRTG